MINYVLLNEGDIIMLLYQDTSNKYQESLLKRLMQYLNNICTPPSKHFILAPP